tara:strand:+ start:2116 stop:3360 length:1245 start_codon:yes stop_codon:yes gene_type:complete
VKTNKLRPIVLAGGTGKRLWPLSTKDKPKQFIPLFGEYSLFDLTLQRLNQEAIFKKPIIVTSRDYLGYVEDSMTRTGIVPEKIILEPASKNTFPAISFAVITALLKNKKERFLVAPSDHYISKNKEFHNSCKVARDSFEDEGLILFGVKPENPSSEYGYITTPFLGDSVSKVRSFIEKPNPNKAKELISKPGVLWNAGMFIFEGSWFLKTCKIINKDILKEIIDLRPKQYPESLYVLPDEAKFKKITNSPFDKIFVENNTANYVILLKAGWSDLGSWFSLSSLHKNLKNEMTPFPESGYTREEKPWGFFENLMETQNSKVKLLSVLPDQKLSLQRHKYRSETWYVIQGEAKVTKSNERFTLLSGDSITIEKNEEHRLENLSDKPLEIIEIQTGTYFGEDDIIRIKDSYGRADLH